VRTIVKGKNAEIPDRVRDYAERKLKRIERLLDDQTDATVELWSEPHKSAADTHSAEVTLMIHGQVLRSRATDSTYEAALDEVVDKVERQAVDYKEKPRLRARPEEEKQILRRLADGVTIRIWRPIGHALVRAVSHPSSPDRHNRSTLQNLTDLFGSLRMPNGLTNSAFLML
jgi:putative sigma-54 modulation protein